ncbi:16S rRNA (guanine(966)-N(2))-methyltransferase RsmD [bacterium]|nr:16S rRNA (guanine(966)-N(2))-methyltransferase RsmD [bacterium]
MRVIAGTAKGTKLFSVPGDTTRPILDRVKTSLFDILHPHVASSSLFLDLFAGSGSVGIEALSRGTKRAIFLDLAQPAVETIRKNLEKTKLSDRAEVRNTDAFGYIRKTSKVFDTVYIAPPQYEGLWVEALRLLAERDEVIAKNGKVIVQIDPKEREAFHSPMLELSDERTYGNTCLLFYNRSGACEQLPT